jgi:hypothetical protein
MQCLKYWFDESFRWQLWESRNFRLAECISLAIFHLWTSFHSSKLLLTDVYGRQRLKRPGFEKGDRPERMKKWCWIVIGPVTIAKKDSKKFHIVRTIAKKYSKKFHIVRTIAKKYSKKCHSFRKSRLSRFNPKPLSLFWNRFFHIYFRFSHGYDII